MSPRERKLSCGTTENALQRFFDGDLHDPLLAEHVKTCPACTASLDGLAGQRAALSSLFGGTGGEAMVGRILQSSRRSARAALANLLYELAKAFVRQDAALASRVRMATLPRRFEAVAEDVAAVRRRLAALEDAIDLPELESAAGCLDALAAVEGISERQTLLMQLLHQPGPTIEID